MANNKNGLVKSYMRASYRINLIIIDLKTFLTTRE